MKKRKANNLFFWVGRYPTNLTYDNGKKSIKIYITNAAESINGKVTDRSVFINGTPVYNVTFKDRRMTWDYNTDSLQPNQSKGDIVFMGVFANVYIGNKFSGTLEIKSNITGKKESYKITGFSRILTPKSKADKDKTDKNKDGSDKNKDGSDKNKDGSDKNKDGSDKNKDGSDKNKDGSDKNKDGSDKNKDGSDKNKDGSDKNKDTINSHDYHKEMSVGFAKYKTKVFGEQLWTVENMRHYPSAAP
ncbi:Predicted signal-transduction protein containing cAMP-binding and CBS domains [uncultured Gammaproteobacteria bacterium]|nr:Predicted signal-transduction protein containing cAMP-binding and CBS domains [uncultured Gammaproteobacteria bacterium]